MLTELQIKNVAIIDNITINFGAGFNVLTGETGAGKSILIDSINMALGEQQKIWLETEQNTHFLKQFLK